MVVKSVFRGLAKASFCPNLGNLWIAAALILATVMVGCSPSVAPAPKVAGHSEEGTMTLTSSGESAPVSTTPSQNDWNWDELGELVNTRELWDISYFSGHKVGYEHTVIEERLRQGRRLIRILQNQVMTLRRFSESLQMTFELESWQTPEGELLAFRGRQHQGITAQEFSGVVAGDSVRLEQTTLGRKEVRTIPWEKGMRGFRAVEESVAEQPLEPGHRWSVRYLMPIFNTVVQTDLEVKQPEPVRLLSGTYELIRVDMRTHAPIGLDLSGTIWVDRSGEVLKSFTDLVNLETYRGSREDALAEPAQIPLDLGFDIRVPVLGKMERPHDTTKVRYRVRSTGEDPARLFTIGLTQRVSRDSEGKLEIVVYSMRPDSFPPEDIALPEEPPTDADLAPSAFVQSDYPAIVKLAESATKGLSQSRDIAVALEKAVFDWITDSNYKVGFATAAEVVDSRQGDCTEHAVLLAALARAKKLPARLAMGLVYNQGAFYYHMWTEIWIADRWYPFDATLGRGGIGAAHLKMGTTSLDGPAALARMLPILQALGRLEIEILEVSYDPHMAPTSR